MILYDYMDVLQLMAQRPQAAASIRGGGNYSQIRGEAYFYQTKSGVMVVMQAEGLPANSEACKQPIFAVHIHSGGSCSGNETDPFADAMTHYNPKNCPHPYHAGDMPPLFGCNGFAFSAFVTDRFTVSEVVGKTVIIHANPDDFTTQPSGNSGAKIACGTIQARR